MWIAVVIIVLAAMMMIGPLMVMRPTKRQVKLAGLRRLAQEEGLYVRMREDPSQYNSGLMAVYSLNLTENDDQEGDNGKKRKVNRWLLTRRKYAHGLHFHEDWDWEGSERPAEPIQEYLRQHLDELDGSVLAIESTGHALGVYWRETLAGRTPEERVGLLTGWLRTLAREHMKAAVIIEPV